MVNADGRTRDGNVYFADTATNRVYRVGADGKIGVFRENAGGRGDAGSRCRWARLRHAAGEEDGLSSFDGASEKIVAQNMDAEGLAVTAKGTVYFTDVGAQDDRRVGSDGRVRVVYSGGEMAMPAGLALSPDQAMLIVTDAQSRFSWSFQIASDGSLTNGEPFYRLEMPETGWMSGVRAAAEDSSGQVYFATPVGIQMCEANGRSAAILNAPGYGGVAPTWRLRGTGCMRSKAGRLFRRAGEGEGHGSLESAEAAQAAAVSVAGLDTPAAEIRAQGCRQLPGIA